MKKGKVLPILHYGDPVLREKAVEIDDISPEIINLAHDMIATMRYEKGIGLAGPQVGISKKIIAIGINDISGNEPIPPDASIGERILWNAQPLVMINPKIKKVSSKTSIMEEGCLSIPKLNAEVERPVEIEIEGTIILESGKIQTERKISFPCGNLLSICFQHELDHLDGILYTDRASDAERNRIAKPLAKLEKQNQKKR